MSNEEEREAGAAQEDDAEKTGEAPGPAAANPVNAEQIQNTAKKIITDPAGFYQNMPKRGGLADPLIFIVIMSVVAGVLSAILSVFGLGSAGAMAGGLVAIILIPIFVVIFSFIGAGIVFIIWKMMGSQEDYETAFRCVAYTAAIAPLTALLGAIPYVGSLVSALWPMALLAIASIHVHRLSVQASWGVFGVLGIFLALMSVSGEYTSRNLMTGAEDWQKIMEMQRE